MSVTQLPAQDLAAVTYRQDRVRYWDDHARRTADREGLGRYYHRRLAEVYRFIIPPGSRALEMGCARGDVLAWVRPAERGGVGIDFSPLMIEQARRRHPNLRFVEGDALDLALDETFDYVMLSDLLSDLWDVQRVLTRVRQVCTPRTRVILNFYSRLWEWP